MPSLRQSGVFRRRCRQALLAIATIVGLLVPGVAAAQSGTIQGTVRNAANGVAISGATVTFVGPDGASLGSLTTTAAGTYQAQFLPPSTYFLYVTAPGFAGEYFDNLPCPLNNCRAASAPGSTGIIISGGVRTANVALTPTGAISGVVRAGGTGAALANVLVVAFVPAMTANAGIGFAVSDAAGAFTVTDLPGGEYRLFTDQDGEYIDEVFGGEACDGACALQQVLAGAPIGVNPGATTTGRDFSLDVGGRIAGVVTDAVSGLPLALAGVTAFRLAPAFAHQYQSVATDGSGAYTIRGLRPGQYRISAAKSGSHAPEAFDDQPCTSPFCGFSVGVDVPVALGQTRGGVNFALSPGATITGVVRNAANQAPIPNISVVAYLLAPDLSIRNAGSALSNASGVYALNGLGPGTYFLTATSSGPFIDVFFPSTPCLGGCQSQAVTGGTPISVGPGATSSGHDFQMTMGGQITGVVTGPGGPVQNVFVTAVIDGAQVKSDGTDATGAYAITGLAGATYRLSTSNSGDLVNEVFPDVPCLGACDAEQPAGAPVVVTTGGTTAGRNFTLATGGVLTGVISDAVTGARLDAAAARIVANVGGVAQSVAFFSADELGRYRVRQLPSGVYYAATFAGGGRHYANEIFDDQVCPGETCELAAIITGTPIPVAAGATTERNFALATRAAPPGRPGGFTASSSGFQVAFAWQAPTVGGAPVSYQIEAGLTPGTTALTLPAAGLALTVPGAPPGRFFVRVRALNAFGAGPPSDEVALVIGASGASLPPAPFMTDAYSIGAQLVAGWVDAFGSAPVSGYQLEVGTASGLSNIATVPVSGHGFTYRPVPPGVYFLRVRAVNSAGAGEPSAEQMVVAGGAPSPPGLPVLDLPTVTGSTVTLAWRAPRLGPVTSYILEAGTGPGLANLVRFNTGSAATSITFPGVPSGTYFVRVRAVNAIGASVVSNEVTVVVP